MNKIVELRRKLHQNPELSNKENETSKIIEEYMLKLSPDLLLNMSKTGKAYVFDSNKRGYNIMFRAELDALPIQEASNLPHSSSNDGVAHLCGHDGHLAILVGLAERISLNRPKQGKIIFLTQPAEEVEQGAYDVINDPNFLQIEPDFIFALHNVPGFKTNSIIIKEGSFAAASKGMTIKFFGKTSHAAEPENGISPAIAISKIILEADAIRNNVALFSDFTIVTVIHSRVGEISFGTSPGYGELMMTLRAYEDVDMNLLTTMLEDYIDKTANEYNLKYEIEYSEIFPATFNDKKCVEHISEAAKKLNLVIIHKSKPFSWSEDFGYYTQKYNGGFFGLGAGMQHPPLHNPNYDFPDEIIETGINVFFQIYKQIYFDNE
ncbi:MAG: amidohydrolase [Candidatus Kapabacteria bacterium]|nr:amidohydrolase [Candidatus Kapabacteria bacterium]